MTYAEAAIKAAATTQPATRDRTEIVVRAAVQAP
jgi:hypothetical protein